MERHHGLFLALWREACRHTALAESVPRFAALIADVLPVERVALWRVDSGGRRLECLGEAAVAEGVGIGGLGGQVEVIGNAGRLGAWCRQALVAVLGGGERSAVIPAAVAAGVGGSGVAVPLFSGQGAMGILVLGLPAGRCSEPVARLAGMLREPLSVALENDRRLHELVALREAAEADKRKLLHRLGREALTGEIVGAAGGLRAVMERVALVTRSDVPVLLFGETGSGKEVVARCIHEGSARAGGPFIRVNCGAIPPALMDSELFGHERGSFTGAVGMRRGWFERADGGTLFLDEIGELPAAAQVRLLRVLQDGSFERVGGERTLRVDVRVIAATHRDLARMVQERAFREDLWYRIAVFPVVLPPLRERQEDIPALATHFAERAARRFGLRPCAPTPDDIRQLRAYPWPGNVRELASVLDRAAILGDGKRLEVAAALGIGAAHSGAPPSPAPAPPAGAAGDGPVTLDDAMRQHIEGALRRSRGRIEGPHGAAIRLRINPHTLRARMRKLEIDWRQFRNVNP